jgi:hypothetical protein
LIKLRQVYGNGVPVFGAWSMEVCDGGYRCDHHSCSAAGQGPGGSAGTSRRELLEEEEHASFRDHLECAPVSRTEATPSRPASEDPAEIVSLEHFGAGADYLTIYERFGITADAVVDAARRSLSRLGVSDRSGATGHATPESSG